MDDFAKYEQLRRQGATRNHVYEIALADNLDAVTLIRMMRRVFNLSLREVKETKLAVLQPGETLEQYQERFLQDVNAATQQAAIEPVYERSTT